MTKSTEQNSLIQQYDSIQENWKKATPDDLNKFGMEVFVKSFHDGKYYMERYGPKNNTKHFQPWFDVDEVYIVDKSIPEKRYDKIIVETKKKDSPWELF